MTARRLAVPMPPQIARLPRDPRGYPIPYVAERWAAPLVPPPYTHRYGLVDAPDRTRGKNLRMGFMDGERQRRCWIEGKCQVCARRIKGDRYLAGGVGDAPLDQFAFREPPTCGDCMVYAAQVCPGLVAGAMADPSTLRVVRVWDPASIELLQERMMPDATTSVVPDDPNLPEAGVGADLHARHRPRCGSMYHPTIPRKRLECGGRMTDTEHMTTTATFQVGTTYSARSAGDHNCVWSFEVTRRTAKFITLRESDGDTLRVGVRVHDGEEWASPFGTFSMCPVIRAGRTVA